MSRWEPLTGQELDEIMRDAEANVAKLEAERKARKEAEAQAEELRNVLRHCLYRLEENVQILQSAGYFAERDTTKLAALRVHEVLNTMGGLNGE